MGTTSSQSKYAGTPSEWYRNYIATENRNVPCGDCSICCQRVTNVLVNADEIHHYNPKTMMYDDTLQGVKFRKNPDGSCINLKEGKCTIWKNRPKMCRGYDCRAYFFIGLEPIHKDRFSWFTKFSSDDDERIVAALLMSRNYLLTQIFDRDDTGKVSIEGTPFAHAVVFGAGQMVKRLNGVSFAKNPVYKAFKQILLEHTDQS